MNKILKIIKADPQRKSRLHDLRGNFIGFGALFALPVWLWHWSRAKCGVYARLPWIPPSARMKLELLASSNWTVLECGSGMSSLWWAKRVKKVISLESNTEWHKILCAHVATEGVKNIELHLVQNYEALLKQYISEADLIVIDGDARDKCTELVATAVRKSTWVYLDNVDFAAIQAEMRNAEQLLLNLDKRILVKEYFQGMPPGQLAPTQGLLVRLSPILTDTIPQSGVANL